MKLLLSSVIAILCLAACNNSEMSIADLEKADWNCIDSGVCVISKETSNTIKYDSLQLTPYYYSTADSPVVPELLFKDKIDSLLQSKVPGTETGYLRINYYKMLPPPVVNIYFSNKYDSAQFSRDEVILKTIRGVNTIHYTSAKDALKGMGSDSNEDWADILEENPLPALVQLQLDRTGMTKKDMQDIHNYIKEKLPHVTEVSYPQNLLENFNYNYYYSFSYSGS